MYYVVFPLVPYYVLRYPLGIVLCIDSICLLQVLDTWRGSRRCQFYGLWLYWLLSTNVYFHSNWNESREFLRNKQWNSFLKKKQSIVYPQFQTSFNIDASLIQFQIGFKNERWRWKVWFFFRHWWYHWHLLVCLTSSTIAKASGNLMCVPLSMMMKTATKGTGLLCELWTDNPGVSH